MTTPKAKSDAALWQSLAEGLTDDLLDPNMPEDEVARELEALDLDPVALAQEGEAFVAQLGADQRLSWQVEARRKQEAMQRLVNTAPPVGDMDRDALLARLNELRATDPAIGTAIRAAARKRKPETSSTEDLRALVEDMEALRAIEKDKGTS
ncbi:MAG: hypothetical protein R3B72_27635 [Polyangiaceae bacterium]